VRVLDGHQRPRHDDPDLRRENSIVAGKDILTPVEKVQVWFEQDVVTSTMFSSARSNAVEVDLTDHNTATRLYSNGIWSTPKTSALFVDPATVVTIVAVLTAAVVIQDLASKIASKLTGVYKDIKVDVATMGGTTVKITYQEQRGLAGVRLNQTRMLLQNQTVVDQLAGFALESFAQLNVGYVSLNATTPS
jgi:hypothetical protein